MVSDTDYVAKYLQRKSHRYEYANDTEYITKRKERHNYLQNVYQRHRYATDESYRLLTGQRKRLRLALKGKTKPARTLELISCTLAELVAHLESQLPKGAKLADYHVDHIIPCAAYDFTNPEDVRRCFNYRNLQPLLPADNLSKGAKIPANVPEHLLDLLPQSLKQKPTRSAGDVPHSEPALP